MTLKSLAQRLLITSIVNHNKSPDFTIIYSPQNLEDQDLVSLGFARLHKPSEQKDTDGFHLFMAEPLLIQAGFLPTQRSKLATRVAN